MSVMGLLFMRADLSVNSISSLSRTVRRIRPILIGQAKHPEAQHTAEAHDQRESAVSNRRVKNRMSDEEIEHRPVLHGDSM